MFQVGAAATGKGWSRTVDSRVWQCRRSDTDRIDLLIFRDDLGEFPYLSMCIKESLRCVPAVPRVFRELTTPLTVDGVTLLPGTIISICVYDLHHNSAVWGKDHMVSWHCDWHFVGCSRPRFFFLSFVTNHRAWSAIGLRFSATRWTCQRFPLLISDSI